jgi:hypothetical protein
VLFPVDIGARTVLVPIDTCPFLHRDASVCSRDAFVLFHAPLLFAQLARLTPGKSLIGMAMGDSLMLAHLMVPDVRSRDLG